MNRRHAPRNLDLVAASPIGDVMEFAAAFLAIRRAAPTRVLTYVGTDGRAHYFRAPGDPMAYTLPVSPGWTPPPRPGAV